ncbi:MAG TPA: hypothetical protein VFC56_00575 [Stellaceae bacterium]|nr:hypothetical protein [Stellaceae bacterium]
MRLALIGLGFVAAVPAQAQLLTHKDLSLAVATTIAQTAYDKCTAEGYGVSVVDEPCVEAGIDKVADQLK